MLMLPVGESKVSVCKCMFLRTLCLKTDGRVTEFVGGKLNSLNIIISNDTDKRGKAALQNKICRLSIQ